MFSRWSYVVTGVVGAAMVFSVAANASTNKVEIIRKMHALNETEIRLGEMAKAKGTNQSVKSYGAQLVNDHVIADRKVNRLAKDENIDLKEANVPVVQDQRKNENALVAELTPLQGKSFDQRFMVLLDNAHKDAIAELRTAQTDLAGTPTAKLIADLLPTMEKHANMAEHMLAE